MKIDGNNRLLITALFALSLLFFIGEERGAAVPSLHYKAYHLDLKGVQKALKAGTEINRKDGDGRTPIFYCLFPVHPSKAAIQDKIMNLLLGAGADVNAPDRNGVTPLLEALAYGNIRAAESMINYGASPVHRDNAGSSALHKAAGKAGQDFVKQLLQAGCDVNWKDKSGWTPLHEAAENGNAAVVSLLIEKGADVNAVNEEMNTPLHLAVLEESGDAVKSLVRSGADVNAKNLDGNTPLFLAIREDGDTAVQELLDVGSQVNIFNKEGTTPLHRAAYFGLKEIAGKLIGKGAAVNAATPQGVTPIHLAVLWGHYDTAKALADGGADLSLKTAGQRGEETPLHVAARMGEIDIIRMLLYKGASPLLKDGSGKTPYEKALEACRLEAARMILAWEKKDEPYYFVVSSHAGAGKHFATSILNEKHRAERAFDGSLKTCWIGGNKGDGESVAFYSAYLPKRLRIYPGWGTASKDYLKNNRVKKILFSLYAAERRSLGKAGKQVDVHELIYARELLFSDEKGYHEFLLPVVKSPGGGCLGILEVKEIYQGDGGLTCIAEINPLR